MINRFLEKQIKNIFGKGKAIILLGARQTGKTTILSQLFENKKNVLWLNADEPDIAEMFEHATSTKLKTIFGKNKIVVLDESQRIKNIGLKLKLVTDNIKEVQLIATGSSAFELSNKINEPLTGRKWELFLYPFSFAEMAKHHGTLKEHRLLKHRLIYGYYPDVVNQPGNEKLVLKQLTDSYLYKDILMWENIKRPEKLIKLMQALALQLGNEVSYNELSNLIGVDKETVEKYIQLLEKVFVIFRLGAFARNLRTELKRSRKIYFLDNGIRNALIANFSPPELRQDIGALWENFLISERVKHIHYSNLWVNQYFWRTHEQQEIDYLEDTDGKLFAYEFKWNTKAKNKFPSAFIKTYPQAKTTLITPDNFEKFVGVRR